MLFPPVLRTFGPVSVEEQDIDTPTLTASDNGDGTGITFTVSGASTGTTNTIYVSSRSAGDWTTAGAIAANGSLDVDLDVGSYVAAVVSSKGGYSVVGVLIAITATSSYERDDYYTLYADDWQSIDGVEPATLQDVSGTELAADMRVKIIRKNMAESKGGYDTGLEEETATAKLFRATMNAQTPDKGYKIVTAIETWVIISPCRLERWRTCWHCEVKLER